MTVSRDLLEPVGFYVTGGTLEPGASSYVLRACDTDLLESLLAGEFCYVLNSRQMGKSSLMVRTRERLCRRGIRVAVLDLTSIGRNVTPEQWYDGLLSRLGRQIGLEDELEEFCEEHLRLPPLQRWLEAITRVALTASDETRDDSSGSPSLVIFVDEIDVVRSLPFCADEFFAAIRQCYMGRATNPDLNRVAFCLIGMASPAELIQDSRTSPFNFGRRIEIADFTAEESVPLADGLGSGFTPPPSDPVAGAVQDDRQEILHRVLYWTHGHPYLTQALCRAVVDRRRQNDGLLSGAVEDLVDRVCVDRFLSVAASANDDNLQFVRSRLQDGEARSISALELYIRVREGHRIPDQETDAAAAGLKLAGIARNEKGMLVVRNRIYASVFDAQWARDSLPHADLKRLQLQQRSQMAGFIIRVLGVVLAPILILGVFRLMSTPTERAAASVTVTALAALLLTYLYATDLRPPSVPLSHLGSLTGLFLLIQLPYLYVALLQPPYFDLRHYAFTSMHWIVPLSVFAGKVALSNLALAFAFWFWCRRSRRNYSPLVCAYLTSGACVAYVFMAACIIQSTTFPHFPPGDYGFYQSVTTNLYVNIAAMASVISGGAVGYTVGVALRRRTFSYLMVAVGIAIRIVLDITFAYPDLLAAGLIALLVVACCSFYLLRRISRPDIREHELPS